MLKMIINDRIQVEGKNRDHQEIKIHASYMIANNSPEAVGLEPVDRRFSVPEITNQSIVDRYGRPWIRELTQKLDDPGLLASFAKYVLEEFKEPRWYNEEPYQTSRFEEIVIATARSGISQTLRKILGREEWEYTYEEERDLFKKKNKGKPFPVLQDWQRFFKDVKIGGSELCEVAGSKIIPVERYRPDDEDDRLCHTQ